jgi:putative acetyltransferase
MFLRAFRRNDKRLLQELFFEAVHQSIHPSPGQEVLDRWAPAVPDRETWAALDEQWCYVVEHHKTVVGFIALRRDGVLAWLYVHPDHQGKGIAKALLRQMERQLRRQSRTVLTAAVLSPALPFFTRQGYRNTDLQGNVPDDSFGTVVLEKTLDQDNPAPDPGTV